MEALLFFKSLNNVNGINSHSTVSPQGLNTSTVLISC